MKIGKNLVVDLTPEQYFEQVEKKLFRFFGNHIDERDVEEGFLDTYDTSARPLKRVSGYNPEGYEISRNNMVSEEIVPFFSLLNLFNVNPDYDGLPGMTEENVKNLDQKTQEKWIELQNEHIIPQKAYLPINGIFGDEDRFMTGEFCGNFKKAYDITKDVVLMDDTNDEAQDRKEDAIAKLCTRGLKNIMTYANIASKLYGMRDYYVVLLTISKMLDWIDENQWLKDKVQLEDDEWTYLKGLKALGGVVRDGEIEYDKFIKNDRKADAEAAERYRKFSYALYRERQAALGDATKEVDKKLDSVKNVFEKDDEFCKLNCLGNYANDFKDKYPGCKRAFTNCEDMITYQKLYSEFSVPTVSDIVKKLGKCTSKEEIDDLVREETEKAGEIPENYKDQSSFAYCFRNHHETVKVIEPKEIPPLTDEKIKADEQSRNSDISVGTKDFFKGTIKGIAEEIYSQMDLFKNDNRFRGSSQEYRDTKDLLEELIELSKRNAINRRDFKHVLDTLEKNTQKYLNKKDAASGVQRTERNNDSYANRRYNLMLRCSEMVTRMKKKEDAEEFGVVMRPLAGRIKEEVKLLHPEVSEHIMSRGIEYVLIKNSGKTSETFKKDLIRKYYDGALNESQLIADNRDDLKAINDFTNESILNMRKTYAQSGMSVGEADEQITGELDNLFDAAIKEENEAIAQKKKAIKDAKAAVKDKPKDDTIKRRNSL